MTIILPGQPVEPNKSDRNAEIATRPFVVSDPVPDDTVHREIQTARIRAMVDRATRPSPLTRERDALATKTVQAFAGRRKEVTALEQKVQRTAGPILHPPSTTSIEE